MSAQVSFSFALGPVVLLVAAATAYVLRWRRSGRPPERLALFLGGILVTAAALLSPVDTLGEQLFFMHMVQHVLLLDVAPILLILGLTKVIMRPVTRVLVPVERRLGPLGHPAAAVVLYVGVMWLWHVPSMYDAANAHELVHAAEHLMFSAVGLLYWWHVLSPIRPRMRLTGLGPAGYMLATKVGVGLLGVALTFAPRPLYAFYTRQPEWWGIAHVDDQALAGATMALEQAVVMGIALTFLFIRMLGESERDEQRAERFA